VAKGCLRASYLSECESSKAAGAHRRPPVNRKRRLKPTLVLWETCTSPPGRSTAGTARKNAAMSALPPRDIDGFETATFMPDITAKARQIAWRKRAGACGGRALLLSSNSRICESAFPSLRTVRVRVNALESGLDSERTRSISPGPGTRRRKESSIRLYQTQGSLDGRSILEPSCRVASSSPSRHPPALPRGRRTQPWLCEGTRADWWRRLHATPAPIGVPCDTLQ